GRLSPGYIAREWRWANRQRSLFDAYAALVTASGHMRAEYVRNGVAPEKVHAIPLFSTLPVDPAPAPDRFSVLFLGRMTALKGGDLLVRAVAYATALCGASIPLLMAGDGPRMIPWLNLAASLQVDADFHGWVNEAQRLALLRAASVLAVPSVWPEPFGLVGLEAGSQGVPALAFDVGGIGEWLKGGVNGHLLGPPRVETLGEALAWAATHPEELAAMRPAAAEAARAMSLDAHVDRLEAVLADAARAPAAAGG
ncbi:MAG: glycosyltransferase family 4 protein, partial [Longimicrobiaceae bacterium]